MSSQNMQRYWAQVRACRETITEPWPYLVSVANEMTGSPGGVVMQVAREDAGRLLAEGTHRLATQEEVAAELAAQDDMRQAMLKAERDRRMLVMLQPEEPKAAVPKGKQDK